MISFLEKVRLVAVTEVEGIIDYKESSRYPITLKEARRRALRQCRKTKEYE